MRLPRWLDRERRIYDLKVLLQEKTRDSRLYFRLWRNLTNELEGARAERDEARGAVKAAERQLDAAKQAHQIQRTEHFAQVRRIQDERERWERLAENALIPPPSVPVNPDDRAALYRLEQENERLRAQLAATVRDLVELRTKYEGATPS